jgi:hypothetical protein
MNLLKAKPPTWSRLPCRAQDRIAGSRLREDQRVQTVIPQDLLDRVLGIAGTQTILIELGAIFVFVTLASTHLPTRPAALRRLTRCAGPGRR